MKLSRNNLLNDKQNETFFIIQKVVNAILHRKGILPLNVNMELDYFQWASNRLFYQASRTSIERITLVSSSHFQIDNIQFRNECKRWLNLMHRSLGIKGAEVSVVQVRRKLAFDVEFIV
jgi:hypothetical protein